MQWKEIKGYEGYYKVSDTGIVFSMERIVPDSAHGTRIVRERILKQAESKSNKRVGQQGYYVVNLRKYGNADVRFVHRLVAEAFIPNPENLPTINHIDGDKHNNSVDNLEWVSSSENNIHAIEQKLRRPRGSAVAQLTLNGELIKTYRSICEASRETGIGRCLISHCVNNRVNSAGNYLWKRLEGVTTISNESTAEDELPPEVQEQRNAEDIVCTE